MTASLGARLTAALAGTVLEERLATSAADFVERRSDDAVCERLDGRVLRGLARVLATQPLAAGFLSRRPGLLARIAVADSATLTARAHELATSSVTGPDIELESALDRLRVLRHEETCLTATLDLGGVVRFEEVSFFLSILAETITRRALYLARRQARAEDAADEFAIVGMGKIAGREFTYHSDLDLIFLALGAPATISRTSRIGQRLISYLGTMTGAGIAYAVDTRLRPSGHQGVLVTSFDSFERYQLERAETWEHMALMRARAIAGTTEPARMRLDAVREPILTRVAEPWEYIAELRQRVEDERSRAREGVISLKTGPGGLMDVDFLASGGLLEVGSAAGPALPSVPAMLKAVVRGSRVDELLADYRFLRLVESRARWMAGRGVESAEVEGAGLATLAELVEPDIAPDALLEKLVSAQGRIRRAYDSVVRARSIAALGD